MTAAAARMLAKALRDGVAPNLTHLGVEVGLTGTSALAKSKELKAACTARQIQRVRYAGLVHLSSPHLNASPDQATNRMSRASRVSRFLGRSVKPETPTAVKLFSTTHEV